MLGTEDDARMRDASAAATVCFHDDTSSLVPLNLLYRSDILRSSIAETSEGGTVAYAPLSPFRSWLECAERLANGRANSFHDTNLELLLGFLQVRFSQLSRVHEWL